MGDSETNDCSFHCDGGSPPTMEMRLYQAFIFATPILFALVLLLLFYMLYLRRRRNAWNANHSSSQALPRGFVTVVAVPPARGLDKTFRDSLPTVVFNESYAASAEDKECAVCLGDYELDEILRKLPICGHAFHLDCIDKWLSNNTTCPICRASLLQGSRVVPIDVAAQHGTDEQAVEVNGIQPQLPSN